MVSILAIPSFEYSVSACRIPPFLSFKPFQAGINLAHDKKHVIERSWTLRARGEAVCASLRDMPFEPCFHIEKTDDRSFRGSWMGFAYCDFTRRDITLPIVRSSALQ